MPIHDWTRASAGTWHDFHLDWIAEIRNALNGGLPPADYYAQAGQIAGPVGPDLPSFQAGGSVQATLASPQTRIIAEADFTPAQPLPPFAATAGFFKPCLDRPFRPVLALASATAVAAYPRSGHPLPASKLTRPPFAEYSNGST